MLTRSDRVGEAEHEYREASHFILASTNICLLRPFVIVSANIGFVIAVEGRE